MASRARGIPRGNPRLAPKPAFAKNTSIRPKRCSAAATSRLLVRPARHVAADRDRALAELLGKPGELVLGAGGQHHAVPNSAALQAVAAPMPLLAPVITMTGWSGIGGFLATGASTLGDRGRSESHKGSIPGRPRTRGPLRELLPQGLPSGGAARRVDSLHGAQAAGRGAHRIGLVHPLRGRRGRPDRRQDDDPDPVAGEREWIKIGGESGIGSGRAFGWAGSAWWELTFESFEQPLFHSRPR